MAKKLAAQAALTRQWQAGEVSKTYLGIVAERPQRDEAKLLDYLLEGGGKENLTTVVSAETVGARRAELDYRYLGSSDRYHLLEITLLTGRKHQIRAQLANMGCPLRGDTKYGFNRSQAGGLIDLHAWKLTFLHPLNAEPITLVAPPPPERPVWEAMRAFWQG
ncbi:MAG: RNA pseudouridine synthase [Lewinella sp.]|nr:RNA pseudouridine synthase [Lewinella sp.]